MAIMKRILLIALLCLTFHGPAFSAEKPETLEGLGVPYDDYLWDMLSGTSTNNKLPLSLEQLSKVHKKLAAPLNPKTIYGAMETSTLSRDVTCMKATGNRLFCRCLGKKLPVRLAFRDYVAIVTGERNLNFGSLTATEIRKLIEIVTGVREKCVTVQN